MRLKAYGVWQSYFMGPSISLIYVSLYIVSDDNPIDKKSETRTAQHLDPYMADTSFMSAVSAPTYDTAHPHGHEPVSCRSSGSPDRSARPAPRTHTTPSRPTPSLARCPDSCACLPTPPPNNWRHPCEWRPASRPAPAPQPAPRSKACGNHASSRA